MSQKTAVQNGAQMGAAANAQKTPHARRYDQLHGSWLDGQGLPMGQALAAVGGIDIALTRWPQATVQAKRREGGLALRTPGEKPGPKKKEKNGTGPSSKRSSFAGGRPGKTAGKKGRIHQH